VHGVHVISAHRLGQVIGGRHAELSRQLIGPVAGGVDDQGEASVGHFGDGAGMNAADQATTQYGQIHYSGH